MRGGLTDSLTLREIDIPTEEMPCRSTSRWTRPTVWLQMPQAGTSKAMSALCCLISFAASTELFWINVVK